VVSSWFNCSTFTQAYHSLVQSFNQIHSWVDITIPNLSGSPATSNFTNSKRFSGEALANQADSLLIGKLVLSHLFTKARPQSPYLPVKSLKRLAKE
jgi:hypothetical protein